MKSKRLFKENDTQIAVEVRDGALEFEAWDSDVQIKLSLNKSYGNSSDFCGGLVILSELAAYIRKRGRAGGSTLIAMDGNELCVQVSTSDMVRLKTSNTGRREPEWLSKLESVAFLGCWDMQTIEGQVLPVVAWNDEDRPAQSGVHFKGNHERIKVAGTNSFACHVLDIECSGSFDKEVESERDFEFIAPPEIFELFRNDTNYLVELFLSKDGKAVRFESKGVCITVNTINEKYPSYDEHFDSLKPIGNGEINVLDVISGCERLLNTFKCIEAQLDVGVASIKDLLDSKYGDVAIELLDLHDRSNAVKIISNNKTYYSVVPKSFGNFG